MKIVTATFLSLIGIHHLLAANPINTPMTIPSTGNITVIQSHNDKELDWVDEQIKAILPARQGISDLSINRLIDPMKYKTSQADQTTLKLLAPPKLGSSIGTSLLPKIVEEPLKLQALFNKSALINGKWYRINDPIRTFNLNEIKTASVVLKGKKGEPLVLFLNKNNNNIKIQTK